MKSSTKPSLNIEQLETYIQNAMAQWDIPGLSLAIVKDGKPVITKGYGTKEIGKDSPVDEHTLFPINGGTRLITASALALLVAEGKLSWGDRLTDVLPEFKTGSELINQQATVIDALAWRIGLPLSMELLACFSNPGLSRRDLLDKLQHITQPSSFRTGQGLSVLLQVAAGEIIPEITGLSWDDFVQKRLFKPLDMSRSITGPHLLSTRDNVAIPHDEVNGQSVTIPYTMNDNIGASCSVYSSAADMARWLQLQLDNGKVGDQTLIPQSQIDMMRQVHMATSNTMTSYVPDVGGHGLGVSVLTHQTTGHRVYITGGATEGFEAFYAFVPELNLGMASMVNAYRCMPHGLFPWIVDRYAGALETDCINEKLSQIDEQKKSKTLSLDTLRNQITHPSQAPNLSLDAYVGVYQHPFMGDLSIRKAGERLVFILGENYEGELPHANHNTFFREPVKPISNRALFRGPLRFNLGYAGEVESLTIAEGEFKRVT